MDFMENAQRGGKGAILMSGHIGNWELLAGYLRARGYPIDIVVKPMRNPLADALYNARRRDLELGIIYTQTATRGIVEALRDRRLVAILADQHAGEDGVEVKFFGRKVSTPRGPAVLALKYGCPIITGCMIRTSEGHFRMEIDGPLTSRPTGNHDEDIHAITQEFTSRLENHIRKYPDQWLWTHRRWRD
jgi:KDO2-lipid IV(A) lauroyltransferase